MKKIGLVALFGIFCFFIAGCSVYKHAAQTLWHEPKCFPTQKDNQRTQCRDREWAEAAWQTELAANPQGACSQEYAQGFKDGFADYLYAGGTGEPPPAPPRRFWNLDYRTPEGRKAVDDWFAGFRRGAGAAREGGYREQVTLKSSLTTYKNGSDYVPPADNAGKSNRVEILPTPTPADFSPIEQPLPEKAEPAPRLEMPVSPELAPTPPAPIQTSFLQNTGFLPRITLEQNNEIDRALIFPQNSSVPSSIMICQYSKAEGDAMQAGTSCEYEEKSSLDERPRQVKKTAINPWKQRVVKDNSTKLVPESVEKTIRSSENGR